MDDKIQYYENNLIPVLKKKIYEVSIVVPELEANILYLRNKISKLELENAKLKSDASLNEEYKWGLNGRKNKFLWNFFNTIFEK